MATRSETRVIAGPYRVPTASCSREKRFEAAGLRSRKQYAGPFSRRGKLRRRRGWGQRSAASVASGQIHEARIPANDMIRASSEGGEMGLRRAGIAALLMAAVTAPAAQAGQAPGVPGALSHFDLARKDCVGTARNTTSRVWFTVADGVLSDVYEPNVDTTNVETMQFIVTDGKSFTDLQSRDMTYSVDADPTGMVCTVTSRARNYRLTTTYSTDPARDTVLVKTNLEGKGNLKLYVRLDPTVGGHGGGGA